MAGDDAAAAVQATAFEMLGPARARLGESPVWSPRASCVWWVDVEGRRLLRTQCSGNTRVWDMPEPAGFVQLDADENPVLGLRSGLFRFDPVTGALTLLAPLAADGVRFNDACTDSHGRLWAGTMDLDNARDCGVVYLITADGKMNPVLDGFRTVNGLAWDETHQRLYVSDSHPEIRSIWTLDCPGGRPDPGSRRLLARLHGADGRPDGGAIDSAGHYWSAAVGGARLLRFAPDGRLVARFAVPFADPTKPAFGGDGLSLMFLTSKVGEAPGGKLAVWNIGRALGIKGAPVPRCNCLPAARKKEEDRTV